MSQQIDFLFEVSWEVCNKVGGIHTVVSTKAYSVKQRLGDNYILIGPDIWRDSTNFEFEEDESLFRYWRQILEKEGIKVRAGHWRILGNPVVFLVDFSQVFQKKNEIFAHFWEVYGLDSLYGQWDYIEPAMFGYAAGQVIESFVLHHLSAKDKIVAQFHEWMTGTGILYLKEHLPHIGLAFTTHATVVGRALAGNRFPLYKNLPNINADQKSREFNVISKHSLEKISAREADVFTTVSDITARECQFILGKKPDIVTPNGFEKHIVPPEEVLNQKREQNKAFLRRLAEALFGYQLPENTHYVAISGRYEFWNKGIDVFIKALANLNARKNFNGTVLAFIFVPADNYGPRKDLQQRLNAENHLDFEPLQNKILTHNLHHEEYDLILNELLRNGLDNRPENHVKVVFVPAYLNGNDGIINKPYYDVLLAIDQTIFPSYYEPWGYTPLESLAFYVPTTTTSLAGFGQWIKKQNLHTTECITVVERNDDNTGQVIQQISDEIIYCSAVQPDEFETIRHSAHLVALTALWKNLVEYYFKAYEIAIERAAKRSEGKKFPSLKVPIPAVKRRVELPHWRTVAVEPQLPAKFKGLEQLARNLWWSWSPESQEVFRYIDPENWEKHKNPIKLLNELSYKRLKELEQDDIFIEKYQKTYKKFQEYLNQKPLQNQPLIAYFSMEYGLVNPLRIYSGGLGVLAGDYLKQASDNNVPMVAVGLLYKYGYFTQKLSINGEQISELIPQNYSELPIELVKSDNGQPLLVEIGFPGRKLYVQIWKVNVGRIPLYLLDTDIDKNQPQDRSITHQLYGGDLENRLKQEFVLGIGGVRALHLMGIEPDLYHMNEGHTAFLGLEVIRNYMNKYHFTFAEALELTRAGALFTTHTPVAAGHDHFPDELIMAYFGHYPDRLKITWEEFMALGKLNPHDKDELFSMSHLAINLSSYINAVSRKHRDVTRKMFQKLWEGYFPEELENIGYVTNGVHFQTWANNTWKHLFDEYFSKRSDQLLHDPKVWYKVYSIPNHQIWQVRMQIREQLINYIRQRINQYWRRRRKDPRQIIAIENNLTKDSLLLGFARRFATYKRAYLLFKDTGRLSRIINNPERPVILLLAGKAHPADKAGQEIIKQVVEISRRPEFLGKIIFLEDYDLDLAKQLVSGVDVWINTPTRPLEASGTSGMKASMNGVLNLSVLDGWWIEGYVEGAGWALPEEKAYENQEYQDQLDAEMLYEILENEVIPAFYNRSQDGVPHKWVEMIKKNIAEIAHRFTTARMIDEYFDKFYNRMYQRKQLLIENDFRNLHDIASWKHRLANSWDNIKLVDFKDDQILTQPLVLGKKYDVEILIDLDGISPDCVGIELVISEQNKVLETHQLQYVDRDGTIVRYRLSFQPSKAGLLNMALRVYPRHKLLPHRQDFAYVKWI